MPIHGIERNKMKDFWKNLKIWQRVGMIFGVLVVIAVVVVIIIQFVNAQPKVELKFTEATNIPSGELKKIRESLVDVISNNTENFDSNKIYVGVVRDYSENVSDDLSTADFVVDFDEILESYKVAVAWPDPDDGSPNLIVSCALLDSKYPETPCTTEANSSLDIESYLPYTGTLASGEEYNLSARYDGGEIYVEIKVNSCGNLEILNNTLNAVREWVASINFDPDDLLFYELTNICDDTENPNASFYFQANRSKTNDANVNKNLPYFVPSSAKAFPVVDENNNVNSIEVNFAGCTDYQTDTAEQWILEYLEMNNINYPVDFEYCAE